MFGDCGSINDPSLSKSNGVLILHGYVIKTYSSSLHGANGSAGVKEFGSNVFV